MTIQDVEQAQNDKQGKRDLASATFLEASHHLFTSDAWGAQFEKEP